MPLLSQAATIFSASPHVGAIGFSEWMALTPALAAAMVIGACSLGPTQTLTMSSFSLASISL